LKAILITGNSGQVIVPVDQIRHVRETSQNKVVITLINGETIFCETPIIDILAQINV
jgi:hypothetical protein